MRGTEVTDVAIDVERGARSRRVRLPVLAMFVFVFGAAGLPGPSDRVEVVSASPTGTYVFNCILHQEGVAAPGVGVLTFVPDATTAP